MNKGSIRHVFEISPQIWSKLKLENNKIICTPSEGNKLNWRRYRVRVNLIIKAKRLLNIIIEYFSISYIESVQPNSYKQPRQNKTILTLPNSTFGGDLRWIAKKSQMIMMTVNFCLPARQQRNEFGVVKKDFRWSLAFGQLSGFRPVPYLCAIRYRHMKCPMFVSIYFAMTSVFSKGSSPHQVWTMLWRIKWSYLLNYKCQN